MVFWGGCAGWVEVVDGVDVSSVNVFERCSLGLSEALGSRQIPLPSVPTSPCFCIRLAFGSCCGVGLGLGALSTELTELGKEFLQHGDLLYIGEIGVAWLICWVSKSTVEFPHG